MLVFLNVPILMKGLGVGKWLLLLSMFWLLSSVQAENEQSIMFGEPEPLFEPGSAGGSAEALAKRCKALSQRAEALKGKPQRRYAALERYRLECLEK